MNHCKRCGRVLTDEKSIEKGYGSFCAKHAEKDNQLSFDFEAGAEEKVVSEKTNLIQIDFHCFDAHIDCDFHKIDDGYSCVYQESLAYCKNKEAILHAIEKYLDGDL